MLSLLSCEVRAASRFFHLFRVYLLQGSEGIALRVRISPRPLGLLATVSPNHLAKSVFFELSDKP